jgi:hypothetical protein
MTELRGKSYSRRPGESRGTSGSLARNLPAPHPGSGSAGARVAKASGLGSGVAPRAIERRGQRFTELFGDELAELLGAIVVGLR